VPGPLFALSSRHLRYADRKRRVAITHEERNELGGPTRAGVRRDEVNTVGLLKEALARRIRPLWFTLDPHPNASFDDVTDDGTRMAVRNRGAAWVVRDLDKSNFESIAVQGRQTVREHRRVPRYVGLEAVGRKVVWSLRRSEYRGSNCHNDRHVGSERGHRHHLISVESTDKWIDYEAPVQTFRIDHGAADANQFAYVATFKTSEQSRRRADIMKGTSRQAILECL
jgi:hypothetical protein